MYAIVRPSPHYEIIIVQKSELPLDAGFGVLEEVKLLVDLGVSSILISK